METNTNKQTTVLGNSNAEGQRLRKIQSCVHRRWLHLVNVGSTHCSEDAAAEHNSCKKKRVDTQHDSQIQWRATQSSNAWNIERNQGPSTHCSEHRNVRIELLMSALLPKNIHTVASTPSLLSAFFFSIVSGMSSILISCTSLLSISGISLFSMVYKWSIIPTATESPMTFTHVRTRSLNQSTATITEQIRKRNTCHFSKCSSVYDASTGDWRRADWRNGCCKDHQEYLCKIKCLALGISQPENRNNQGHAGPIHVNVDTQWKNKVGCSRMDLVFFHSAFKSQRKSSSWGSCAERCCDCRENVSQISAGIFSGKQEVQDIQPQLPHAVSRMRDLSVAK